jgi:peptidoglycan-associated lipoprotein
MRNLTLAVLALAAGCATAKPPPTPAVEAPPATASAPPAPEPAPAAAPTPLPELRAAPILYGLDSSTLAPEAQSELKEISELLSARPDAAVTIAGHTCELGTTEYNALLGARRAAAARDYLVRLGVPEQRVRTISYGKERPADPGHTEEAHQHNRRSEFEFSGPGASRHE